MKILFATMQFGHGYRQGTERYLRGLGDELGRRGHEVRYLAGDPEDRHAKLPLGMMTEQDPPVLSYPSAGWLSVRGLSPRHLEVLLGDVRPDLVHLANPAHVGIGLADACQRRGIPFVITTMDFWWVCPKATLTHSSGAICDANVAWADCVRCIAGDHPRAAVRKLAHLPATLLAAALAVKCFGRGMAPADVRRWFGRRTHLAACLEAAAHVIFPSAATEQAIRPLFTHDRFSRIVYGLDERWFSGPPRPAQRHEPPVIGFAGALARHKGPHLLLEALRRLGWRDCRIEVAGSELDVEYGKRLRDLATDLPVTFHGSIAPEEMPDFLRSLDVFVVPSTWPENAPFAVLEAQAVGVPVLATRVSGIADLIPNPQRLFDVNSPESLAAALQTWRAGDTPEAPPPVSTVADMTDRTLAVYETVAR
ncbi:MAG: glycosyltransferase [Phycisphaerae bacterium]|nr:glycosyltransferase [Phycisphaerae bacterium]